jgi:integrase
MGSITERKRKDGLTAYLAQIVIKRNGAIVHRENRTFPANTDAISAAFTRACKFLRIEDLHFHDLRHDGVSRLFELGWNIPQVACVSGHRSWASLKRYTHIRQRGDKYAGWKWSAEKNPGT